MEATFIKCFGVTALWIDNAHCTFLKSFKVVVKIIRQAIVIDLTGVLGYKSYACYIKLGQLFACYFESFELSQKIQPGCCFLYNFGDMDTPFIVS